MARLRYTGLMQSRKNGRFVSYSRRNSYRNSLKRGYMTKKDFFGLYKYFKGKGF